MATKEQIDLLLDMGFELGLTRDYRTLSPKYVLAIDTNTFVEKVLKDIGIEKDLSVVCDDCYYNDDSTIEIDLNKKEIEYVKSKGKE